MTPAQLVATVRGLARVRPAGAARCVAPGRRRSSCTARARPASRTSSGGCWRCRPRTCARRAWPCARARRRSTAADVDAALTDERSVVVAWLMRGTLHLVGPRRLPVAAGAHGAHAPGRRAAGGWAQEGVAPDDAERAVKIVERALADDGPLTASAARRAHRRRRASAPRARPRRTCSCSPRCAGSRSSARCATDGAHAFALTRDWLGAAPARELDGRRARRRAGRARAPLPGRPRPGGARRPRRLERPAAARRARRAAGDRLGAGRARRRPRRPRRARARARRDPGAPARRLRPLPAGLEGPRVRRPRPARQARPSRRRDAARHGDRRRPRRRHVERRRRRGRRSSPSGACPPARGRRWRPTPTTSRRFAQGS